MKSVSEITQFLLENQVELAMLPLLLMDLVEYTGRCEECAGRFLRQSVVQQMVGYMHKQKGLRVVCK